MEGGEKLFDNKSYNNIMIKYLNYLNSLGQSLNTIRHKITNVSLFLRYLEEKNIKNLKSIKKQDVYNYIQLQL